MLQIYTGTGKGKTTAALGAALRAGGKGMKSVLFAFLKGDTQYGETLAAEKLDFLTIHLLGRDDFVDFRQPEQVDLDMVRQGWEKAKETIAAHGGDVIILDEFNLVLAAGMLPLGEVLDFLKLHQHELEIISTGRGAPPELIEIGDLVTDMQEVKHYLSRGIVSREGFDH